MTGAAMETPQKKTTPAPISRRRRCLFIGLYLVFLLILVELSLQVVYVATVGQFLFARTGRPMYAPNQYSIYWNKPHVDMPHRTNEFQTMVYTNGQGLRVGKDGPDYPLGKQPDVERILLLGPSFAFGWGVDYEQTFAARLQGLLNESRPKDAPRCEVINAGVPSLGPALSLLWYRNVGKDFAPDRVIQFIYGSMVVPVTGNWNEDLAVTDDGYLIHRNASRRARIISYAKRSATVFYGWLAFNRVRAWTGKKGEEDRGVEGAGRKLDLQGTFSPTNPEVVETMQYYNDLRTTVEATGAKLTLVYFPLAYCVHREDAGRWAHLGVRNIEEQIQYDADFCKYLQSEGFDCVNITPDLQGAADEGDRLYYFVDVHWTPEGNQTAAQAAARHLLGEQAPAQPPTEKATP